MHTTKDIWTDVHEERQALLGFLELLTPDQWDAPTLCAEWRVRDVVGHLVSATDISVVRALVAIAASGFRMNRYISKDARGRGMSRPDGDFRRVRAGRCSCPECRRACC